MTQTINFQSFVRGDWNKPKTFTEELEETAQELGKVMIITGWVFILILMMKLGMDAGIWSIGGGGLLGPW